jgi:hypothetical protein
MLATVILQRIVNAILDGGVVRSIGSLSQIARCCLPFLPLACCGCHLSPQAGRGLETAAAAQPETQYRWLMGSSSAGNSVITRQPLSVTTTSSSMRAAE